MIRLPVQPCKRATRRFLSQSLSTDRGKLRPRTFDSWPKTTLIQEFGGIVQVGEDPTNRTPKDEAPGWYVQCSLSRRPAGCARLHVVSTERPQNNSRLIQEREAHDGYFRSCPSVSKRIWKGA